MQLRYSEYYKIDKKAFDKLGVFNGFILHDSDYFLNPKLIKETKNDFFITSYSKIRTKFSNIIKLIARVRQADKKDSYFKAATNAIKSEENGYIGLGYSEAGKKGRGIGEKLATSITETAYKLIKEDKLEPELFELLGVYKEQINVDRISDMIINIILEDILKYTEYIANKLNIPVKVHGVYKDYKLPYNTFDNNNPLFFLPTELLSKLPSWDENFYEAINESKETKDLINSLFGEEYGKYLNKKKYREILLIKDKDAVSNLIKKYKVTKEEAYDFINDPSNDFRWIDDILDIVKNNPLALTSKQSIYQITQEICNKFKYLVENTNAYKLLYHDGTKKKHESASQQAFQLFAKSYCDANNLDISPESNGGRGPVDFKFSQGKEKVLVEIKLSTSDTLEHCLTTQIDIYEKSEGAEQSILLILMVGTNEETAMKKIEKLIAYKNNLKDNKYLPEIIEVDALIKKSASKA
jgi:hypothetical protein